jgi:RNA recognition motif-containing protein
VTVTGLPLSYWEPQVDEMMSSLGPLRDCTILRDAGGASRGAALVMYEAPAAAQAAVQRLDGSLLHGRPISVVLGRQLPL